MEKYDGMRLTAVLAAWLKEQEWKDEVEINEGRDFSRVATEIPIAEQDHRLYLECGEKEERFLVFFYSPLNVPASRIKDAAVLMNRINQRLPLGRVVTPDDGTPRPVQYKAVIDVEGSEFASEQITNMVASGISVFEDFGSVFGALAVTKQSADQIWDEFLKAEKEAEEQAEKASSEAPSEL